MATKKTTRKKRKAATKKVVPIGKKKTTKKRAPKKVVLERPEAPPGWKYSELGVLVRDQAVRKKEIQFHIAEAVKHARFPIDAEMAIVEALSQRVAEDIDREILGELKIAATAKRPALAAVEFGLVKAALETLGTWLKADPKRSIVLRAKPMDAEKAAYSVGGFDDLLAEAKVEDTSYVQDDAMDLRHVLELLAAGLRLE